MPDIIDDAQAAEALHLAEALKNARPRKGPRPLVVDGFSYCADCGEAIPDARLAAVPEVGLCAECQQYREETGQWG